MCVVIIALEKPAVSIFELEFSTVPTFPHP
jgi:hypothetical protein